MESFLPCLLTLFAFLFGHELFLLHPIPLRLLAHRLGSHRASVDSAECTIRRLNLWDRTQSGDTSQFIRLTKCVALEALSATAAVLIIRLALNKNGARFSDARYLAKKTPFTPRRGNRFRSEPCAHN